MDETWVVNASPIITLAQVGHLDLLQKLPGQLLVPAAVAEEVMAGPDDAASRALASGWGSRREIVIPELIAEWGLGKGESAVLALASTLGGVAVVDDRSARRCAKAIGVQVIGTLGVIIRAKRMQLIPAAAPVIRAVLDAGLHYDERDVREILGALGEEDSLT